MTAEPPSATVTVVGHGTAGAVPDLMRLTISVECRDETVAHAYRRAGTRTTAVTAALRAAGIPAADLATSGLSVRAETAWTEERGTAVTGYTAGTTLTVALREIGGADPGAVISRVVEAGGDDVRLGDVELTVADRDAVLAVARDAAWDDARAVAERYAARAGRTLGAVLEITEQPDGPAPVRFVARSTASAGIPIEAGATQLSASVRVTWALQPPV